MRKVDRALIAGPTDRRPACPRHDVNAKTERLDHANDVVDLRLARVSCHYNEHGVKRRLLTRNYTLRSNLTHRFRFRPQRNRGQHLFDLGPMLFVLRWKLQRFAKALRRLVRSKTGTFGGDFKQNSARLAEVDRMEIEPIDYRRDVQFASSDLFAPMRLFELIRTPKRDVMDRSGGIDFELSVRSFDQIK